MRLINADKLENVDFSDCIDSMEIMNVNQNISRWTYL